MMHDTVSGVGKAWFTNGSLFTITIGGLRGMVVLDRMSATTVCLSGVNVDEKFLVEAC